MKILLIKFLEKHFLKIFSIFVIFFSLLSPFYTSEAAINKQINYQGKLTDSDGVAVPDGTYNMEFILYDDPDLGGAHILWTETRIQANRVTVTSGLFSILLGEVTALTSVNFNQTLYLGVNIGGTADTATPTWDGEMVPRKKLGVVPAAVVSEKVINIIGGNGTTLLGSIPYQSDTDTTTLLAPNTTTTKKFLRMTGDGTNGAVPAWDTLVDGDIPSALTGKTYNGLTITANGTNTLNITAGKTLTVQDNVTITGALGTGAYATIADYAPVGQTMYIGTTGVAINRASAALTLAGITLTTPEIGAATGTSLDLGTTTLYGSRAITVDTGGVLNIDIGSAAGDDFTVDTSKLVVEGDTGNVGIGTTTPKNKLDVEGGVAIGATYSGTNAAPANGLLVEGQVAIGTPTPNATSDLTIIGDTADSYAPLTIMSTTASTNLTTGRIFGGGVNGESYTRYMFYADGKYATGPGTATRDTVLSRSAANTFMISSDGATGLGNLVVTGNIGIGDTTPDGKLDVESTGAVTTAAGATGLTISNLTTNADTALTKYGAYITSTGTFTGGANTTVNYGLYVNSVSGADTNYGAYIAGNVGIGTTVPASLLQVGSWNASWDSSGNVPVVAIMGSGLSTSSQTLLRLNRPSVDGNYYNGDVDFNVYSYASPSGYYPFTQLDIALKAASSGVETADVNVMSLRANGNVGIGTIAPTHNLTIGNGATSAGSLAINEDTDNGTNNATFTVPALAADTDYILPADDGTDTQQLTTNGSGTLSWTSAASSPEFKDNIQAFGDSANALTQILNTNVYTFNYKPGMGTGDTKTTYVGIMANEAPWAMHYDGKIINPVNTLGYMILGIQAVNEKISDLELTIKNNLAEQKSTNETLLASIQELDLKISDLSKGQIVSSPNTFGEYASAFFSDVIQKVEGGVVYMKALVVDTFTIGSSSKPSGFTIYDKTNNNPFCVSMVSGVLVSLPGICEQIEQNSSSSTTLPPDTSPSTGDTIAPVITLSGDALINLNVGDTYEEAGATATDNIDTKIAIIISGSVDTSITGVYTITYAATDTAGNSATPAVRTVNVGEVQPQQPEINQPPAEEPISPSLPVETSIPESITESTESVEPTEPTLEPEQPIL